MILVVDASVAVKWFVPELHSTLARELLSPDNKLHVPELFQAEVGAVLCKKILRKELQVAEGREVWESFLRIRFDVYSMSRLLTPAFELALASGQYVYDCIYLILAAQLKIGMVTADRRFYNAIRGTDFKNNILWIEDCVRLEGEQ